MSDKFYYNDGLAINPSAVWTTLCGARRPNLQILVIVEKSAVQSVEAGTDGLVEVGAAGAPAVGDVVDGGRAHPCRARALMRATSALKPYR